MMRQDRIVLPIPPGVHWKDPMPILLPREGEPPGEPRLGRSLALPSTDNPRKTPTLMPPTRRRVQFGPPSDAPEAVVEKVKLGKPAKPKREKVKADPALVAKARELRDRYFEQFNSGLALPRGKYAVGRELAAPPTQAPPLLPAA